MKLRTKQTLAVLAGILVAGAMAFLGLWQMASYEESTRDVSAERAALPPEALVGQIADDGSITDIYGRRVTLTGSYLPEYQVLVGESGDLRVATAFKMDDGRFVTVVRGATASASSVASAPAGPQDISGIFLASDSTGELPAPGADLATLRLQELAQEWPSPLVGGYVTLNEADSAAQGLLAAELILPEAEGSATHRGYALQWWVFAAGAIGFGVFTARGFAKDEAAKAAKLGAQRS